MGCCCNDVLDIGCFDYCQDIIIGFDAIQTGLHIIEINILNGSMGSYSDTFIIGESIKINGSLLNESKSQIIKIMQPDGIYYDFGDGVECIKLTTKINYQLNTDSMQCFYKPVFIDIPIGESLTEILAETWDCLGEYPILEFTNVSNGSQFQMNWSYDTFPNPNKVIINWGAPLPFDVSIKMT